MNALAVSIWLVGFYAVRTWWEQCDERYLSLSKEEKLGSDAIAVLFWLIVAVIIGFMG